MQSDYQSEVSVPHDARVPFKTRQSVQEKLRAAECARVEAAGRQARAAERVARKYGKALRELLGAARHDAYRADLAEAQVAQIAGTPAERLARMKPADFARLDRQRERRSAAILRRHRVPAKRVLALQCRMQAELDKVIVPRVRGKRDPDAVDVVPTEKVPAPIVAMKTNPWTIASPPHPGSGSWLDWWHSGGFGLSIDHAIDKDAGNVGGKIYWSIPNATDISIANCTYRTSVGFWYRMPAAGLVEVWIKAQSARSKHRVDLDDEWGVSSSTVRHWNHLTLQVWDGADSSLRPSQTAYWYESGYTNRDWNFSAYAGGDVRWAHLFSDLAFANNQWVYIDVGTMSQNYVYANDVEVYSTIDYRWFLEHVFVDSTGA